MKDNREWKLSWDLNEEYVIFKEVDTEGRVFTEFSLGPPRYAKLYYALKDWFQDGKLEDELDRASLTNRSP